MPGNPSHFHRRKSAPFLPASSPRCGKVAAKTAHLRPWSKPRPAARADDARQTRSTANPSTGAHDRTASFHQGTAAAAVSASPGQCRVRPGRGSSGRRIRKPRTAAGLDGAAGTGTPTSGQFSRWGPAPLREAQRTAYPHRRGNHPEGRPPQSPRTSVSRRLRNASRSGSVETSVTGTPESSSSVSR